MDAHVWVVDANGKIIDPHFTYYDMVKAVQNLVGSAKHLPAPKTTQEIMLKMLYKTRAAIVLHMIKSGITWKNQSNCCYENALAYQLQHGGTLIFGSLGWKRKLTDDIFYEYGGADWTTVKQFLK